MSTYEGFDHQVQAWTVGQLRAALAAVPDSTPVTVVTAQQPGWEVGGSEQVVIDAGEHEGRFEINLDFPTGPL